MPDLKHATPKRRWLPLVSATISMLLIGLYQHSWTMFSIPVQQELHSTAAAVQLTFTIFTWVMTLTQPLAGLIADRMGPLVLNVVSGLVAGLGWVFSSLANTPESLYLTYGAGGVGVGAIYATSVGTAIKWFPDRRGLATGIVVFGFGFGAAIFNPIIAWIIDTSSFRAAFLYMGAGMLVTLVALTFFTRYPQPGLEQSFITQQETLGKSGDGGQFTPMEMLKTRQWWLLYVAFILTANTGLMIIAQLTRMGTFFRIKQAYIVLASAVFPVTNGVGRIFGGWVSDRFGRERTMSLFFATQGAFSILLLVAGSNEAAFVALISIIGLVYGPIFTFFPSIVADYYGRRSTMNYGITYTAKGWGGLLGGYITTLLSSAYGGFAAPIFASAVLSFAACILVSPKVLKRPTKS